MKKSSERKCGAVRSAGGACLSRIHAPARQSPSHHSPACLPSPTAPAPCFCVPIDARGVLRYRCRRRCGRTCVTECTCSGCTAVHNYYCGVATDRRCGGRCGACGARFAYISFPVVAAQSLRCARTARGMIATPLALASGGPMSPTPHGCRCREIYTACRLKSRRRWP